MISEGFNDQIDRAVVKVQATTVGQQSYLGSFFYGPDLHGSDSESGLADVG